MASTSSEDGSGVGKTRRMARRLERHDQALLAAEIRRLVNELHMSGPLPAAMLARRCRTDHWREGTLEPKRADAISDYGGTGSSRRSTPGPAESVPVELTPPGCTRHTPGRAT